MTGENWQIIGASLSKPHTSVTALRMRVSVYLAMDRPLTCTVNFKWANSNISRTSKSCMKHCHWCEGWRRATVRAQRREPGAKMTEVEARVELVCASTDDGRSLRAVVDCVASGSGPCINGTHKRQKFSSWFGVRLSPCMCSHVSSPGWRNGWHMWSLRLSVVRT